LSGVVPVYLYCQAFSVSVSLGSNPGMHAGRPPSHSAHLAPSAQAERLAVRVDRAYSSLPTCSPAPSVIAD